MTQFGPKRTLWKTLCAKILQRVQHSTTQSKWSTHEVGQIPTDDINVKKDANSRLACPFSAKWKCALYKFTFCNLTLAGATATVGNLITNLSSAILVFATATEFCNVDKIVQRSSLRHSILSLSRPKERKIHNLINTASLGKGCLNQRGGAESKIENCAQFSVKKAYRP